MRPGPDWFILVETIGILSFAINAMIVAQQKGLSALGVFFAASVTALGGGTLRDILLGPAALPFFWIAFPFYIVSIFILAMLFANSAFVRGLIAQRDVFLRGTAEALALASLGGLGAAKAFNLLAPTVSAGLWATTQLWILCSFFGAMSAAFGSIIRDVILNEFPSALKPGSWVLESVFIGSGVIAALRLLSVDQKWALLAGFIVTFGLRLWVLKDAQPWKVKLQ